MKAQPQVKRLRGKTLKIVTTEQEMIEFADLCARYTAYMLDIHTLQEMPSIETISSAAMPYKIFIAKKLSNALGRVVLPDNIRAATLKTVMIGGYFKVECLLREATKSQVTVQTFKLSLVDKTKLPLIMKLRQVYMAKYPDMSSEEFIDKTEHLF